MIINSAGKVNLTQNSVFGLSETLQTMRLASKQEQTDAAVHTLLHHNPPQPEHGLISDRNEELKQSYQADAYQTIESKKSKKS